MLRAWAVAGFALQLALLGQPAHERVFECRGLAGMTAEADLGSDVVGGDGGLFGLHRGRCCRLWRLSRRRAGLPVLLLLKKLAQRVESIVGGQFDLA